MAVSQWEEFEKDLADALRACEAPRPCLRKSAPGFSSRQSSQTLGRSLSVDAAPGLLASGSASVAAARELLFGRPARQDWRLSGCRPNSCAAGLDDYVACVAVEEAPLASPVGEHRAQCRSGPSTAWCVRSLSLEGCPSRLEMLNWQLPGPRPRAPCHADLAAPPGGSATHEACSTSVSGSIDASGSAARNTPGATPPGGSVSSGVGSSPMEQRLSAAYPGSPGGLSRSETEPLSVTRDHLRSSAGVVLPNTRSAASGDGGRSVEAAAKTTRKLDFYTVAAPFQMPEGSNVRAEAVECAICMDSFLHDELIRTLPCCHRFHACCVDPWLTSRWQCPLCKHPVVTG